MRELQSPFEKALTPVEWSLVRALREVPSGPLRERLDSLIGELIAYVRTPRCVETQADGVPCVSASKACAECQEVAEVLTRLSAGLRQLKA
jgi:hypothetical protein